MSGSPAPTQTLIALGELSQLEGYALAGAELKPAETPADVRTQWSSLGSLVGVVILTPRSSQALGALTDQPGAPMTVVLPA
jgi:hypothetical protein